MDPNTHPSENLGRRLRLRQAEKELAEAKALLADAWTALSSVEAATFQTPGPDSLTTRIFAFLQGWKR